MKQKLFFNKLWLRVGMIVAIMTTALSGTAWAEDVTVDVTSLGTQTWSNYSLVSGNVTISTNVGTGSAPTTNNAQYRWKTGNIITISTSTGTLKTIQFKTNSTEAYGPKCLNYGGSAITNSGTSYTWTAPSDITSADFNVTSEARLTEIHVTYTTGGSGGGGDTPSPTEGTGTITFGTGKTTINSASVTGDDDLGNTWTITTVGTTSFTANSAYYQVGSGSKPATSITFTTTLASELNITAMSAKFGGFSGTAGTVTLKVGDTTIGTGSLNGTSDVTVNSTSAATGTVLTVTVTGIAKGVKCYYISYTCTSSTDPTCETPTFSPAAGTYTSAQNVTISTETAGATIYYTTDGTDPTTSSTQYSGAINVSSTTTIKAIAAAEDHNNSPVASATYTIVPLEHAGTQADPYTVADAHTAIDAGVGTASVYATGIVSKIVTAYNSQFGNISYNISTDGTTTSDQLEVFRGKGIDGANFTSADDIQVGDVVVVKGNLTKYNSTYEFEEGNQLVSIVHPATITVTSTAIDVPAAGEDDVIDVTYKNITSVVAEVQFFEADGVTPATYDWITASINSDNDIEYNVDANTGEARTAYMKVYALDNEANDVYSGLITVTQAAYVAPFDETTWTLATSITSGKHYIIVGMNDDDAYAMGEQKSNNRAGVSVTVSGTTATVSSADVHEVVIYGPDAAGLYTIYDGTGYLYAASSTANNLKTEATVNNNARWEITFNGGVASIVATQSSNRNVMRFNYNGGSPLFACYASATQSAVSLYEKAGEATPTESVTVTDAGYATYCSENALNFTGSSIKAYVGTKNGDKLTFTPINQVPASTGMLLVAEGGAIVDVPVSVSPETVQNNCLTGVNKATTLTANDYILNVVNGGAGFYKAGSYTALGAHKAYIPAAVGGSVKGFVIDFDDDATGISLMEDGRSQMEDGVIYNLAGQRISKMQRGINIVNGKKILK